MKVTNDSALRLCVGTLLLSFFLPMQLQTFLFIGSGLFIFLASMINRVSISLNEILSCVLLSGTWLCYLIAIPFTHEISRTGLYKLIETKAGLLLIPFLFLLLSKSSLKLKRHDLLLFAYAAFLHTLVVHGLLIFRSSPNSIFSGFDHVIYRQSFESVSGMHPSYYGLYLVWSLLIVCANYMALPKRKIFHWMISLVFLLVLLALMPKSAMLALIFICLFILFRKPDIMPLRKMIILASVIVGGLLFYRMLPGFQQRIAEVVDFLKRDSPNLIHNSVNIRHLIFSIDLSLLKEHWLLGLGPMGLQEELNKRFYMASMLFRYPLGTYNTHNEYFNQWLSFGLGGMILFLTSLIVIIRKAMVKSSFLFGTFITLMLIAFLTENILSRQHGVLFYSLFVSFFFFNSDKSEIDLD